MKKTTQLVAKSSLFASIVLGFGVLNAALVSAAGVQEIQDGVTSTGVDDRALSEIITQVVNILVFVVGIAAVIMIIIGAIKYITANGDQSSITSAKNTILYSIVGLVLAIAAGAIVNFVIQQFSA